MEEREPQWYEALKSDPIKAKTFTMEKILKIEQAAEAVEERRRFPRNVLLAAISSLAVCAALVIGFAMQDQTEPAAQQPPLPSVSSSPAVETEPATPAPPASSTPVVRITKQGTGEYVAGVDAHTVAINIDGQETAFQTYETPDLDFREINEGDKVWIEYEEEPLEGGIFQRYLKKIKKIKKIGDAPPKTGIDLLPRQKDFTVETDGGPWTYSGGLRILPEYALYVLEGLTFDDASRTMTFETDDRYRATIEKLPAGYKLEEIKQAAEKELIPIGEVQETPPSEISPSLGGALMMLTASSDTSTRQLIVKQVDDAVYGITIDFPQSGTVLNFLPRIYTSVSTLLTNK
ncbi:hypothetical protein SD71_07030 [Cohnella kolymensis]|uniref:DUF4340 domain-containing protein n=1 Tax=Cohnella kolymensis TaxID=1590652 RepID=A0ABR5A386_9BACL|nr:hypothetical protein [Cohnella kolymensis]KIL35103.1 hypothetical protein SD71_15770 [Cohnella kolymensis]KIL36512.1 hypothetical protein SD71_07030 [Cohnella kolymensis]